jgi:hypothetical protein
METISVLVLGASPFIVTWVVNVIKKLRAVADWSNPLRQTILRALVAVLALGGAIATSLLSGNEPEVLVVTELVNAVLIGIAATGLYFWKKK